MEGVEGESWRFVAFVRLVPLFLFNLVNYALGLTRIPLVAYTTASLICMAPGALAYAWLGYAGREALTGGEGAIRNGLLALALLAVVTFLPRFIRQFKGATMITPQTLRTLLAEGRVVLVDVREPAEFEGELGHVPDARNIRLAELGGRVGELAPWRQEGVVLICGTDKRSATAARFLAQHGFAGVRVVRGGTEAWRRLDFPLAPSLAVKGPGEALARVEVLYARMRDEHLRDLKLGLAHQSPDYQWWLGQAALDGDLLRIKGAVSDARRLKATAGSGP